MEKDLKNLNQSLNTEKLYELADRATVYYSDKYNRFLNKSLLNPQLLRFNRIKLIEVLLEELKTIPVMETKQGVTIDTSKECDALALLVLTTHDFTAGLLRSKGAGFALWKNDCPYVNKWNPLVMYALSRKHGYQYTDFWLKGNPFARILLGKELKDLSVPIKESELKKLGFTRSHIISQNGERIRSDIDYKDPNVRIIRARSPLISVYAKVYTKGYYDAKFKMSKDQMLDLIWHNIKES